jgi:hypothetical protein
MGRFLASIWLWLVVYLAVLIGIGAYVIHLRNQMLSDEAEIAKEQESYRQWIEFAKTQTGSTGPVQRTVPTSSELPMLVLMRDHFPVILGASIVFPAIILGFLLLMFHGVLRQSLDGQAADPAAGIDDSA